MHACSGWPAARQSPQPPQASTRQQASSSPALGQSGLASRPASRARDPSGLWPSKKVASEGQNTGKSRPAAGQQTNFDFCMLFLYSRNPF
jgi:hypothetical protein